MGYDAFISYSQRADRHIAEFLQKALHRIAKPWYRMRASLSAAKATISLRQVRETRSRFLTFVPIGQAPDLTWVVSRSP